MFVVDERAAETEAHVDGEAQACDRLVLRGVEDELDAGADVAEDAGGELVHPDRTVHGGFAVKGGCIGVLGPDEIPLFDAAGGDVDARRRLELDNQELASGICPAQPVDVRRTRGQCDRAL